MKPRMVNTKFIGVINSFSYYRFLLYDTVIKCPPPFTVYHGSNFGSRYLNRDCTMLVKNTDCGACPPGYKSVFTLIDRVIIGKVI